MAASIMQFIKCFRYRVESSEFDSITDRGFLFLDAEIDAVAREAVCFENARLVRVNP